MGARGRTCVGCRRLRAKGELVRLVRTDGDAVSVDIAGNASGRGAYVCRDRDCLARASRRLVGALRAKRIDFAEIERDFGSTAGVR